MNAEPLLKKIARVFEKHAFEAILIGNAAAALHGAPVTTLDFDFMFRKTPSNLEKMKRVAKTLGATIFRPYYPTSGLYRLINEDVGLQLDLMSSIHGVRSFASLRSRSQTVKFGSSSLRVASLDDIVKSKRAAGRDRDRAVLKVLERVQREKEDE